jgi:hypothetical protein
LRKASWNGTAIDAVFNAGIIDRAETGDGATHATRLEIDRQLEL